MSHYSDLLSSNALILNNYSGIQHGRAREPWPSHHSPAGRTQRYAPRLSARHSQLLHRPGAAVRRHQPSSLGAGADDGRQGHLVLSDSEHLPQVETAEQRVWGVHLRRDGLGQDGYVFGFGSVQPCAAELLHAWIDDRRGGDGHGRERRSRGVV